MDFHCHVTRYNINTAYHYFTLAHLDLSKFISLSTWSAFCLRISTRGIMYPKYIPGDFVSNILARCTYPCFHVLCAKNSEVYPFSIVGALFLHYILSTSNTINSLIFGNFLAQLQVETLKDKKKALSESVSHTEAALQIMPREGSLAYQDMIQDKLLASTYLVPRRRTISKFAAIMCALRFCNSDSFLTPHAYNCVWTFQMAFLFG